MTCVVPPLDGRVVEDPLLIVGRVTGSVVGLVGVVVPLPPTVLGVVGVVVVLPPTVLEPPVTVLTLVGLGLGVVVPLPPTVLCPILVVAFSVSTVTSIGVIPFEGSIDLGS